MKKIYSLRVLLLMLMLGLSMPATVSFATEATAESETEETEKKEKKIKNAFDEEGNFHDRTGYVIQKSTIRHFLEVALQPVGKTMYIWGGGWNRVKTGEMGVPARWEEYFNEQTEEYNYKTTRYQTNDGLDCSGYVGWVLYNTFNTESGHGGYVMLAQQMAKTYADWGWGLYEAPRMFEDQKAGDIMSLPSGHVYIVIGRCSDGSLVIVHSSPNGCMITGTVSSLGKKKSQAWKLARKYMKKYYRAWYTKYPDIRRPISYLTSYGRMSWYVDGRPDSVMSDPEGLRNKSAEEVLQVLFR